jgi:hypothetical protein
MRPPNDSERRARIAEDITLGSPRWSLVLTGILVGLACSAGAGWLAAVPLHAPAFALLPTIAGMGLAVVTVLLPLLKTRRRERWIVLNGIETTGCVTDYTLDGMASSGAGFAANDNYPVIIATVEYTDCEGRVRTAFTRRTVLSLKLRDLADIRGRRLTVYRHARYPDLVVPAEGRL